LSAHLIATDFDGPPKHNDQQTSAMLPSTSKVHGCSLSDEEDCSALTWNHCVLESIRNHRRYAGNGQLNPPMCWVGSIDSRLHIACGFDCMPKHYEPLQRKATEAAAET
jgi:hypothetical protein